MSTIDFFRDVIIENQKEVDKVRELQKILDQLVVQKNEVYTFSVTSDM